MHEIGIADSILQAVRVEAARHPCARPVRVGMRIGELAGVDPEALRFCLEILTDGTDLEHLQLEIEVCRRQHRCAACKSDFLVSGYDFRCPTCGGESKEFTGGDQLEFSYLEMEEYESSTA